MPAQNLQKPHPGVVLKDVLVQPVRGAKHVPLSRVWRAVVGEFIGTLFFTFVACASVTVTSIVNTSDKAASYVAAGLAQGLCILILVAICGNISGGHINPAVTLSLMTIRSIKFWVGVYYIIFQISGAVIGAALFQAVVGMQEGQTLGYTLPATGNMGQAFLMEYMITALLIFTVLGTAIHPGASVKPLAPIPIGFAVVVGVIIAGGVTGGSMNPARSIGPAVISNTWEGNWVYWAAPSAAAISVALLYKLVFLSVQVSKEEVDMLANGGDSTATLEGAPDLGAGYRYVSEARAIDAMAADMSLQSVRIDKNRPKVSAPQAQTGGGANGVASTSALPILGGTITMRV